MSIDIKLADNVDPNDLEQCIFCNSPTEYWAEVFNRPVCPLCSVLNTNEDISTAKFNY